MRKRQQHQSQFNKAAIYCRVSTVGQEEEGTSLVTQEEHCRKYAAAHGYLVDDAQVYREVYTGAELWDRPQLTRLREAIGQQAVGVVLAYAIDRLSRDPVHLGLILTEAEHHGVTVAFVTEPLDNTPEGQLIRFVRGYAAKVEHEKIRERSLRGKRARIQGGKLHNFGLELYGYRRDKPKGVREVYEPEAAIVRDIFTWVLEGHSLRAILQQLNRQGIPSPGVGKTGTTAPPAWGKGQLHRLLKHPAYKGQSIAWRYTHAGHLRPASEWIALPDGTTPAIVSPAVWDAVQTRLARNRGEDGRNQARPYLLRGRIICAVCGRAMRTSPERGGRRTYRCSSRETPSGPCGGKRVPADAIEAWVWDQMAAVLQDPSIIAAQLARQRAEGPDPVLVADRAAAQRRLAKLDRQQARLMRQFREGDDNSFPWELVKREIATIEEEKRHLQASLAEVDRRLAAAEVALKQWEALTTYCTRVAQHLTRFDFAEKRLALDAMAIRVIANGGQVQGWRLEGAIPLAGMSFPPPPGADRLPHDERLIRLGQPRQLLGEHRHALPPGTGHLRDVGAPEQPLRTEGVVDLPHERVHGRERIWLARVPGHAGRLDGHVGVLRQRQQRGHVGHGGGILERRVAALAAQVVDRQP
jgi:site-specific DNA recombinase